MNIDDIINTRKILDHKLQMALSTMEKKDTIMAIRKEIIQNQKKCPHFSSKYNWVVTAQECPYCGFHFI